MNGVLENDPRSGWRFIPEQESQFSLFPRYRGAFEDKERPPNRIAVVYRTLGSGRTSRPGRGGDSKDIVSAGGAGASVRFRAPFPSRRNFATSITVAPEFWRYEGSRRAWHFFSHDRILVGLFSSLPATWLAQFPDGTPLPPPWRELWTFGRNHLWSIRIGEGPLDRFADHCLASGPPKGCESGVRRLKASTLESGGSS